MQHKRVRITLKNCFYYFRRWLYLGALSEQIVHHVQRFSSNVSAFQQIQIKLDHDGPGKFKFTIFDENCFVSDNILSSCR